MIGEWLDLAACRDSSSEFVDVTEAEASDLITSFCARCPVQHPCGELGYEQTNLVRSVWGGRVHHRGVVT